MREDRDSSVEVFKTSKLESNHSLLTGTKKEAKMAEIVRNIHVYC